MLSQKMKSSLELKIYSLLVEIMSDGFNRSIGTLEKSGAIDTKKMKKEYVGVGSKYYDIVTKELEYTAIKATKEFIKLIEEETEKEK
jgi:hypothetical protein